MGTIKEGTYVFKQTITNPTSNISAVTFKNVKGYYLTANNTYVSAPEDITDWNLTPNGCSFSVGQKPNNMNNWTTSFYDFSSGGIVTYTANDTTLLRTIIVTADQTNVSEEFYNWFMSNIETTPSTSQVSIDLTTLSGWGNVANGQHQLTVQAKADGYKDSEKSTAVSFTKGAQVYTDCLTFTGKTSEFTLKATNKTWNGTLEWSTDHNTWKTLTGTEAMQSVGKKLYLRGKGNTTFYDSSSYRVEWVLSEKADCSGNIQTLLDWENPPTNITANNCYRGMFWKCSNLTSAPELPATTLADYCYNYMFYNCTNLTTAPELPATTLAYECYNNMFKGCTNLTSAPKLPATTLENRCYMSMFSSCTNLTTAPELPATTLKSSCYENMFYNCTNLTRTPELPATTLNSSCYAQMFKGCTNLTSAPKLPATTLASNCYYNMFKGCSKLKVNITSGTKIFTCPSTIPSYAVDNMFSGTGGTFTGTPTAGNTYYWTA